MRSTTSNAMQSEDIDSFREGRKITVQLTFKLSSKFYHSCLYIYSCSYLSIYLSNSYSSRNCSSVTNVTAVQEIICKEQIKPWPLNWTKNKLTYMKLWLEYACRESFLCTEFGYGIPSELLYVMPYADEGGTVPPESSCRREGTSHRGIKRLPCCEFDAIVGQSCVWQVWVWVWVSADFERRRLHLRGPPSQRATIWQAEDFCIQTDIALCSATVASSRAFQSVAVQFRWGLRARARSEAAVVLVTVRRWPPIRSRLKRHLDHGGPLSLLISSPEPPSSLEEVRWILTVVWYGARGARGKKGEGYVFRLCDFVTHWVRRGGGDMVPDNHESSYVNLADILGRDFLQFWNAVLSIWFCYR